MSDSKKEKPHKSPLELTLVRHGEAIDLGDRAGLIDFDRPLSERGRQQAVWVGGEIAAPFDLILVSDAVRTKETWKLMASVNSLGKMVHFEHDAYLAGRKTLQKVLLRHVEALGDQIPYRILFVGHNPGISHLLEYLSGCDHSLKTADGSILTLYERDWRIALEAENLWKLSRFLHNPM